jgi:DUF971 family protein
MEGHVMKQPPLEIRQIVQNDNHTFNITWTDEVTQSFRLGMLQQNCPCAQCNVDGKNKIVDNDVRAIKLNSVGRYAMKIKFTSGCSNGIFTYAFLRELAKEKTK